MIEAERRIREALEKAPTHGEWVAYRTGGRPEVSHAIPPFIAACNPTNIAALLADRDEREAKMLAEIDRLRAAVQHEADCVEAANAEIARLTRERDELVDEVALKVACINGMSNAADKLAAERDEARAERDAMAKALKGLLSLEEESLRNYDDEDVSFEIRDARTALAQIEQERNDA